MILHVHSEIHLDAAKAVADFLHHLVWLSIDIESDTYLLLWPAPVWPICKGVLQHETLEMDVSS